MKQNLFFITLCVITIFSRPIWVWCRNKYMKSPYRILKFIKAGKEVDAFLSQLGHTISASRTAIIEFDGGLATMTFEWCAENTPRIINHFQKIRTSSLSEMLLELEVSGMVVVDENSNPDIVLIHDGIGVKSSYKFKLYNTISKGCLVVAFDRKTQLTPEQINFIKSELIRLKLIYK